MGVRNNPNEGTYCHTKLSSPASSFQHPSQDPAGTETRDSTTMEALPGRLTEAVRLSNHSSPQDSAGVVCKSCSTVQGSEAAENPDANGASHEQQQIERDDVVDIPSSPSSKRTTACPTGYVPTPGPKEQPNTNMNDVAKVDHMEEAQRHDQTHFMAVPLDTIPPNADIPEYDMHLLNLARHADPFRMLGCHKVQGAGTDKRVVVVRVWLKNVNHVELRPRAGVSDWRLPPPLESVKLDRKGELLFHKASTKQGPNADACEGVSRCCACSC